MSSTHCKAKAKSRTGGQHPPSPQGHGLQRPRAQARRVGWGSSPAWSSSRALSVQGTKGFEAEVRHAEEADYQGWRGFCLYIPFTPGYP